MSLKLPEMTSPERFPGIPRRWNQNEDLIWDPVWASDRVGQVW